MHNEDSVLEEQNDDTGAENEYIGNEDIKHSDRRSDDKSRDNITHNEETDDNDLTEIKVTNEHDYFY